MILPTQFEELKAAFPDAFVVSEGGVSYVRIPNLQITVAGQLRSLSGLLCPEQHGGYQTRLFLSEQIPGRGNNWTTAYINGNAWHVWSWNGVPASLSLMQILSAHLRALQ